MQVALLVAEARNMGVVVCENFDTRIFMGCGFCRPRIRRLGIVSMFRTNVRTIANFFFFISSALLKMKFGDNTNE